MLNLEHILIIVNELIQVQRHNEAASNLSFFFGEAWIELRMAESVRTCISLMTLDLEYDDVLRPWRSNLCGKTKEESKAHVWLLTKRENPCL